MSLQNIAQQIAAQGRGNDDQLVHMSRREVAGLQALAAKHGMRLPRNPQTGLIEANFLDSILPAVAGIGLMAFAPELAPFIGDSAAGFLGTSTGAGLAVGGADALATGSLQKGLVAGLGAYGGASLGGSLTDAGAAQIANSSSGDPINALMQAKADPTTAMQAALSNPMDTASYLGDNMSKMDYLKGAAALAPAVMSASTTTPNNAITNLQNTVRPYTFTRTPTAAPGAPGDASTAYFNQYFTALPTYQAGTNQSSTIPQTQPLAGGGLAKGFARGDTLHGTIGGLRGVERLTKMATGGISNLGSYSDGGQLLRGPGDGVSDSIPAQIGQHQPARLAEGEFVVPARIVSELGNGSTNAGAKQLYSMIDRIQAGRRKTVGGKHAYADDTNATNHLPA